MNLIDGKKISENILNGIKERIASHRIKPGLAVVLVGDDEASHIYVDLKEKAANDVGINFFKCLFEDSVSEKEVIKKIKELNSDENIDGIIVQLPLPEKFDTQKIINSIVPKKDVDGFHPVNIEDFFKDKSTLDPVFPRAIVKMIDYAARESDSGVESAIIVVNSEKFGDVMSKALEKKGIESKFVFCENVIDQKESGNVSGDFLSADVIITACGNPGLIDSSMAKDGAIIIDGGIKKVGKKVFGDVDVRSFKRTNCRITPVPGGVGPVTVACLLENVFLVSAW